MTISTIKAARNVRPLRVLGSTVNMVDLPFIVDWMTRSIEDHRPEGSKGTADTSHAFGSKQLVVTGFHGLNQANKDAAYRQIGNECDLWVPDSIAPVLIARFRGMKHVVRTTGADIMTAFMERANCRRYKSYFYGDSETTLSALTGNLEKKYPQHEIVGAYSPPFRPLTEDEEQQHIDAINEARPDVLWVGLGLPKQDEWIYRCKDRLNVPIAAGVGAAFGFLAGLTPRAPKLLQSVGLEWAYMVVKKPKRTGRRVLVDGSQFIWSVMTDRARTKAYDNV